MHTLSYIMSIIALGLYCSSYFFNTKKKYLTFQLTGNLFLSLSYLFMGAYFTMVSAAVGIVRGVVCYTYEQKGKRVPVYMITAVLPYVMWAVSNWCFSSLMDGDGKLSDVMMVTAFATLPMTICNLIQIPLSHFLSSAEGSIFTFIGSLGMVWGYLYVFLAMIIVHQYSVAKGIGTTILTIVGMAVIAFVAILIFFLLQQVTSFFMEIGTEVIFRLNE